MLLLLYSIPQFELRKANVVSLIRLNSSIMLKITYGYNIDWLNIDAKNPDPLVDLIEKAMHNLSLAAKPMSWIIDVIPAVKHLPDWFPLTSYRKTAQEWRNVNNSTAYISYNFVQRQMALGQHRDSHVSQLLENLRDKNTGAIDPLDEEAIIWTGVSLYAAGSDSTSAIISSVVCGLVMFPDVQRKAQEELDRVVGKGRLPEFSDRASLPYINGIVKEAWRWNPVGPMGMVHETDEDIIYNNHLIPKGSYLLPSLWWFMHDPKNYHEPLQFKPERYYEPYNETDSAEFAFGYGRRSCAGRYFADNSVFLIVSRLLYLFDFKKARDASGNEIPVHLEPVDGMFNRPAPFEFKVEARSQDAKDLVDTLAKENPAPKSDRDLLKLEVV